MSSISNFNNIFQLDYLISLNLENDFQSIYHEPLGHNSKNNWVLPKHVETSFTNIITTFR